MGNVVTLADLTPAARWDGVSWTSATISESATSTGPFALIDTFTFAVDVDPTQPGPHSFTTTNAQLPAGWYQVTFLDENGGQQVLVPIDYPPPAPGPELAYCSVLDVQARTSSRPVTATSKPSIAQVQGFIAQAAAEINAILVNNGYDVPIVGASYPDAFATVHKANIDGAWAMMEQAAPTSVVKDVAQAAWDAARRMLSDNNLVLNAPQDLGRANPRGPWLTAIPSGRTYDPTDGRQGITSHNSPRNPYFARDQRF